MIVNNKQLPSLLILAFDELEEQTTDLQASLSALYPDPTDRERYEQELEYLNSLESDVYKKTRRIPIPIDDRLLPIQHTASNTSTSKGVTYDDGNVILFNSTNYVNLRFIIKNNVTQLSNIADVFLAVADVQMPRFQSNPRVSFFGSTMCIFNGYLTGINRATVDGSDQEIISLTIEKSEPSPEPPNTVEKEKISDTPAATAGEALQPVEQEPETAAAAQSTATSGTNAAGKVYFWYELGILDDIYNIDLPQIRNEEKVNRLDYLIHKSRLTSFEGVERRFLTVQYNATFIPLGLNDYYPYFMPDANGGEFGYSLDLYEGVLYLGLETSPNAS